MLAHPDGFRPCALVAPPVERVDRNDEDPDQWLFPGGRAGHPISSSHLSKRLAAIGVDVRAARNGAMLQLAGEVPAVVLADLLSISVNTAVKWVRVASGDWSNYAADRAMGSTV